MHIGGTQGIDSGAWRSIVTGHHGWGECTAASDSSKRWGLCIDGDLSDGALAPAV